jgi:hypothetical protein
MARLNTSVTDAFLPGEVETAQAGIDIAQVIDDALPALHAASRADLTFWSEVQLVQWLDEAVKRLAAIAAVFIGRNVTVTVPGTATSVLPPQHVVTTHVTVDGVSIRPVGTMELEARDPAYLTTQGTPAWWYEDMLDSGIIGLAPIPDSAVSLAEVYNGFPPPLDLQQTMLDGPPPLKGYLAMCLLAEAYGQEGEMEMPDVAEHCRGRVKLYEQLLERYYGQGI